MSELLVCTHTQTHTHIHRQPLCPASTGINHVTSSSIGALLPQICRVTSAELILGSVVASNSWKLVLLLPVIYYPMLLKISPLRRVHFTSCKAESVWLHWVCPPKCVGVYSYSFVSYTKNLMYVICALRLGIKNIDLKLKFCKYSNISSVSGLKSSPSGWSTTHSKYGHWHR